MGHNSYLSVLVELGLIGFVIFAIILAIAFIQAWRQPKWQSWFWLTVLAVWRLGAFTLTWEARKSTWLFLSFIIVSAAITNRQEKPAVIQQLVWQAQEIKRLLLQKERLLAD